MDEVHWVDEIKPIGNTYHVIVPKKMKESIGYKEHEKVEISIKRVV